MDQKIVPLPFTNGRIPATYAVSDDNPRLKILQMALVYLVAFLILVLGFIVGGIFQEYKDTEKFIAATYNLTGRGCMSPNGHIGYCAILQFNECSRMVEAIPRNLTACDIAESGVITKDYASLADAMR